jgi:hypothetical protein
MHDLFKASDKPNIIIRVLFVDFSKAFDLIDHNVLANKFNNIGIPDHITAWSLDFLSGRKQFVKIGDNISSLLSTHAGTPQGTLAGPNDFKLIINDLQFDIGYIKYVDDTTVYSASLDPDDNSLQTAADKLLEWTQSNGMLLNANKTKEMVIYFGNKVKSENIKPIIISGKEIEHVKTFKLLGVIISSDMSWDHHVEYILSKVAKRFYCIRYLVCAGIRDTDVVEVYC